MIVNGKNNLCKDIVKLTLKEKVLTDALQKINDRYETATNLKLSDELQAIQEEGAELQKQFFLFIAEKVTVMTIYVSRNQNFKWN